MPVLAIYLMVASQFFPYPPPHDQCVLFFNQKSQYSGDISFETHEISQVLSRNLASLRVNFDLKESITDVWGQLRLRVLVSQNWHLYGPKLRGMPFSQIFYEKSPLLCPDFVKKRPSSKKHAADMPIFFNKTSILSKPWSYHDIFLYFLEKPPTVIPIFGKKR